MEQMKMFLETESAQAPQLQVVKGEVVEISNLELVANYGDNGVINDNIDALEVMLKSKMDEYALTTYVDDDPQNVMSMMKKDRAKLNDLVKKIDRKRIDSKRDWTAPITQFETRVKGLTTLITEQSDNLGNSIHEIEAKAKADKQKAIREFYNSINMEVEEDFRDTLYKKLYDVKWENASTTKKAYQEALSAGVLSYTNSMRTLTMMQNDFLDEGILNFKDTLDLASAIQLMNTKTAQKEAFISAERERIRKEEEKKAQRQKDAEIAEMRRQEQLREQTLREELQREAEAKRAEEIAQKKVEEEQKVKVTPVAQAPVIRPVSVITEEAPPVVSTCIVEFNSDAWNMVKRFCDKSGIGYTEK